MKYSKKLSFLFHNCLIKEKFRKYVNFYPLWLHCFYAWALWHCLSLHHHHFHNFHIFQSYKNQSELIFKFWIGSAKTSLNVHQNTILSLIPRFRWCIGNPLSSFIDWGRPFMEQNLVNFPSQTFVIKPDPM